MKSEERKKWADYAAKINGKLAEIFDENDDFYIDPNEMDVTEFFHALSTVAPCHIFNKFTGQNKNHLEFNHLANQLCFQYLGGVDEE